MARIDNRGKGEPVVAVMLNPATTHPKEDQVLARIPVLLQVKDDVLGVSPEVGGHEQVNATEIGLPGHECLAYGPSSYELSQKPNPATLHSYLPTSHHLSRHAPENGKQPMVPSAAHPVQVLQSLAERSSHSLVLMGTDVRYSPDRLSQ